MLVERTPHRSALASRHLLPQGEKEEDSIHHLRHRLAARGRVRIAAEIPRAQRAFAERALDGADDRGRGLLLAEMLQHHRARPDHADRVGDALPGDIGRRAVHRLEHRREIAFRIDVARRRDADGAGAGRTEIGEDIAEQIRADHDVEPVRMQHEVRGENVDVVLVPLHLRIILRHRLHALVPIGHRDRDAVGLGRRGQVLLRPRLRQLEREFQDAVDADRASSPSAA